MSYNIELNKTINCDLTDNQIVFELQKMVSNMHLKINALSGIASIALKILYIVSIIPIALLQHNILHLSMKRYCLFLYIYNVIYLILSDISLKKLREYFYSYIKKFLITKMLILTRCMM